MAFTFGFYDSLNGDRRYKASDFNELIGSLLTEGVFENIGQKLFTTAGTGMNINVGSGKAWFDNTWNVNDSTLVLTVPQSDITRPRYDAVVLEVNMELDVRENKIKIISGSPAVNPTKPVLTNTAKVHQHPLAYILVPAAATSITASNIEIVVGQTACPFVTGVLQKTDITGLYNQWNADFQTWFNNLKSQLSDNVVTNLQNQITTLSNQVSTLDGKVVSAATESEVQLGTVANKYVSPATLKSVYSSARETVLDKRTNKLIHVVSEFENFVATHMDAKLSSLSTVASYNSCAISANHDRFYVVNSSKYIYYYTILDNFNVDSIPHTVGIVPNASNGSINIFNYTADGSWLRRSDVLVLYYQFSGTSQYVRTLFCLTNNTSYICGNNYKQCFTTDNTWGYIYDYSYDSRRIYYNSIGSSFSDSKYINLPNGSSSSEREISIIATAPNAIYMLMFGPSYTLTLLKVDFTSATPQLSQTTLATISGSWGVAKITPLFYNDHYAYVHVSTGVVTINLDTNSGTYPGVTGFQYARRTDFYYCGSIDGNAYFASNSSDSTYANILAKVNISTMQESITYLPIMVKFSTISKKREFTINRDRLGEAILFDNCIVYPKTGLCYYAKESDMFPDSVYNRAFDLSYFSPTDRLIGILSSIGYGTTTSTSVYVYTNRYSVENDSWALKLAE